jgi:hypothetical protein
VAVRWIGASGRPPQRLRLHTTPPDASGKTVKNLKEGVSEHDSTESKTVIAAILASVPLHHRCTTALRSLTGHQRPVS